MTGAGLAEDWHMGGFGLYIHWPFCQSKCPYCDFNSHVSAEIDQKRWLAAYLAEIARLGVETQGRTLQTIFFGGGTPSLMDPALVHAILEKVRATWPMVNDPEITLEANPTSVEASRFQGYREAGVNRISMGIQALNDADLKALGRRHSVVEAEMAFAIARNIFDRVSFDLIYARQDQTLAEWRAELTRALALSLDHLSLYQLTIEDGTAFGARHAAGGLKGLPDDDLSADLYALTQDLAAACDRPAYEISNHAAPGAESRHNMIYWRYGDYVGIGPGAHGRLTLAGTKWATEMPKAPLPWLIQVEKQGHGELQRTEVPLKEQATEYLMMSLRLSEGADLQRYESLAGQPVDGTVINRLTDIGMIRQAGPRLIATDRGRMVLNAVLRDLLVA